MIRCRPDDSMQAKLGSFGAARAGFVYSVERGH